MTNTPPPTTLSTPSPTEHDSRHDFNPTNDTDSANIPSASTLQAMNTIKASKPIHLIVATALKPPLGIGLHGGLPWPQLKADMSFFRKATIGSPPSPFASSQSEKLNAVLMGRKTYDSIPAKFRPLSDRVNVILTRSNVRDLADKILRELTSGSDGHEPAEYRFVDVATVQGIVGNAVSIFKRDHTQPVVVVTDSLQSAVDVDCRDVFCIGGAEIYGVVLRSERLRGRTRVVQTLVRKVDGGEFECDTFWPVEMEGREGWKGVGMDVVEGWVGCEVPQGKDEWKRDEKAGVEIRVVGWERGD